MLLEPIESVVNFPFYRQITQKSIGRAIGYVAYIGFLFSVISTVAMYVRLNPLLRESIEWAATNIPTLTFANGKATSALTAPALIRHPRLPNVAIMIDTKRAAPVTIEEMTQHQLAAYLTQSSLYLIVNSGRMEQHDLSKMSGRSPIVVNGDFYRRVGSYLSLFLFPIMWLTAWGGFFIWKLLAALVYSLLGLAINALTSSGLVYEPLFKIAVYAQTPVVFLQSVLLFLPRQIPGFFVIAFLIVGVYTWQAIRQQQPALSSTLSS